MQAIKQKEEAQNNRDVQYLYQHHRSAEELQQHIELQMETSFTPSPPVDVHEQERLLKEIERLETSTSPLPSSSRVDVREQMQDERDLTREELEQEANYFVGNHKEREQQNRRNGQPKRSSKQQKHQHWRDWCVDTQ